MHRFCRLPLGVLAALLLAGPVSARVLDYRIDAVHTQILFSVDHNGFSYPVGRMRVQAGWLRFDEHDWSTAKVIVDIDTASVDLGDKQWNEAVTDKRFLDAKDFPLAHFESISVEKTGARNGVLHGNLALRGVTHDIAIPFTVNRVGFTIFGTQTLAGFSGRTTLDRMRFGMTVFPKAVGQSVDMRLEVEAILDQGAQKEYEAGKNGTNNNANEDASDAATQH